MARIESGSIRFVRFHLGGHGELEIARVESSDLASLQWGVSRDGSRLFHYVQGPDGKDGIHVVELPGGSVRDVKLKGVEGMQHAEFTSDGRALFVTAYSGGRSSLFRADFNGKVTLLRGPDDLWMGSPVPSPDGRHLAFMTIPFGYDLWLLENF